MQDLEKPQGIETLKANKVPLAEAAETFAIVCSAIDEGNLDETLVALFNQARLDLGAAVDKRICFFNMCRDSLEAAKAARDAWRERVKQLEALDERIKSMTLEQVKITGMKQVKGGIGRLCIQDNPEALGLEFPMHDLAVSRVLDPSYIEAHNIPEKYLKKIAAFQLDTKQIKEDLQAGETYPWARLTRGQHIRART